MFEYYDTWREKYEVSAIREGQLTAELGQKERELEDLRREFKLWIREWKDEKAELERFSLATCAVEQVGGKAARVHQGGTGDLVPVPI